MKENIASTSGTILGYDVPVYDMPNLFDQTKKDQPSKQVSNLRNFLGSCVNLLNDKNSLQVLPSMLKKCNSGEEMKLEQKREDTILRIEIYINM